MAVLVVMEINLKGGAAAPTLVGTGLTSEEIAEIAKNGTESGKMPPGII